MSKNKETMIKKTLEQYFTAIQERFIEVDKRFDGVDKRFDEQDKKLQLILNIVQSYDHERKEVKASLWEHDRRLLELEKGFAKS